jgi:hypothetical protein
MKWLIGTACVAVIAASSLPALADNTRDDILEMATPYCAHTYSGDEAVECIKRQISALTRLAALKSLRGADVDAPLKLCIAGQFVDPESGVNFDDAFKCVSARISS